MTDKGSKIVSVDEWAYDIVKPMVLNIMRKCEGEEAYFGSDVIVSVYESLIGCLVGTLVYKTLTKPYKDTEQATAAFTTLKTAIQSGVTDGLSEAVKKFSGKELDYWCVITASEGGVNKDPI